MLDIEVISVAENRSLGKIYMDEEATVKNIKLDIAKQHNNLYVERQSIRSAVKGKDLKDNVTVKSLKLHNGSKIYVKDLGPQISWRLVFLCEYLGPLILYLIFVSRPWLFYGSKDKTWTLSRTAQIAAICWTVHYAKRLLETIFVHRFSHSTMPLRNLFKNCGYYWGFTAYVAYHTNHPLFTPPMFSFVAFGLTMFVICELGNLSIHLLLRDLRPLGTKIRKIPVPNCNILTRLYSLVSCPNYTYEFGAWLGFSIMTSCLPALIFAGAGMFQMTIWAREKHRNYRKEFADYPKQRNAIIPFIL
ncbi:hypothetical protein ILUMI_01165 [Ignelater luminosus]|uniref:very-long-chain enoyl-CoA reductase n=1 Tax=Ignelater luminosus TaxID=2038154 RepID=A0A8K0GPH4_IGNLU|nr:hypothetical protein ILUMI_01165 [Ignelater luminosus]